MINLEEKKVWAWLDRVGFETSLAHMWLVVFFAWVKSLTFLNRDGRLWYRAETRDVSWEMAVKALLAKRERELDLSSARKVQRTGYGYMLCFFSR